MLQSLNVMELVVILLSFVANTLQQIFTHGLLIIYSLSLLKKTKPSPEPFLKNINRDFYLDVHTILNRQPNHHQNLFLKI